MRTTIRRRPAAGLATVAALAALAVAGLAGCGTSSDDASDGAAAVVTGSQKPGTVLDTPFDKPDLILTDTDGKKYDLVKETKGKPTLIYFGYTHCPDVCPTTMSDIAIAKSRLGKAQQAELRVVFITTDPARDTPRRLRSWLDAQDKTFIGLTGDFATIQAGARSVGVAMEKPEKEKDGSITSTHGAQVLAYSPKDDKAHVLYLSGTTSDQYLADLPKIIKGRTP